MAPQVKGTRETERLGVAMVTPLLRAACRPGSLPLDTNTLPNSEEVQRTRGDFLVVEHDGVERGVEVKSEKKWTGNLFLETWSNAVLGEWERKGWIETLRADHFVAAFLDLRVAVVMNFMALRDWWFATGNDRKYEPRIPELSLSGEQRNLTLGHLVPFTDLPGNVLRRAFRFAANGTPSLVDVATLPAPKQRRRTFAA